MSNVHHVKALSYNAHLLESGDYSDLTIQCDGVRIPVHKAIVCPASAVLAAAIKYDTVESQIATIKHELYDLQTVKYMLKYIYEHDYSAEEECDGEDDWRLLATHLRVYAIANYYCIPLLQQLAMEKFNVAAADGCSAQTLASVIETVCSLGLVNDTEVSVALKNVMVRNYDELAQDQTFLNHFNGECSTGRFMGQLLQHMIDAYSENKLSNRAEVDALEVANQRATKVLTDSIAEASATYFVCVRCRGLSTCGLELIDNKIVWNNCGKCQKPWWRTWDLTNPTS